MSSEVIPAKRPERDHDAVWTVILAYIPKEKDAHDILLKRLDMVLISSADMLSFQWKTVQRVMSRELDKHRDAFAILNYLAFFESHYCSCGEKSNEGHDDISFGAVLYHIRSMIFNHPELHPLMLSIPF